MRGLIRIIIVMMIPGVCVSQTIHSLAVDYATDGDVYTSTYGDGLWVTDEDITSWYDSSNGLDTILPIRYHTITCVAIAPSDSNTMYCGNNDGHVYKSINQGDTWTSTGLRLNRSIRCLAVDPGDTTHVFAGGIRGLYEYTAGKKWNRVFHGRGHIFSDISFDPFDIKIVYAVTSGLKGGGLLYRSTDCGLTWNTTPFGHGLHRIGYDASTEGTIYIASHGGVYRTINDGVSWEYLDDGLPSVFVSTVVVDPVDTSIIYAGTTEGVYFSDDKGSTWLDTGFTDDGVTELAFSKDGSILYIGTENNGLMKQTIGE